jgi:excisionase family DNA binding protein
LLGLLARPVGSRVSRVQQEWFFQVPISHGSFAEFGVLDDERIFTAQEVAQALDCNLGHVYDLIGKRRLRASNISVGKRPVWRIKESALRAFLAANENSPIAISASQPVHRKVKSNAKTAKPADTLRDEAVSLKSSFAVRYMARKAEKGT